MIPFVLSSEKQVKLKFRAEKCILRWQNTGGRSSGSLIRRAGPLQCRPCPHFDLDVCPSSLICLCFQALLSIYLISRLKKKFKYSKMGPCHVLLRGQLRQDRTAHYWSR